MLRAKGASVIEVPLIEIRPPRRFAELDSAVRHLADYDWLILTSVNGVEALFARMRRLRVPLRALRALKISAIGPATKAAIEKHGMPVTVTPKEYVAEAVVSALRRKVASKRVLLLRAAVARDVIPRELRNAGARVKVVAAYETRIPADADRKLRKSLNDGAPDVITFTSSSTVRNFVKLAGKRLFSGALDGTALASIGPITSHTLREHGLRAAIEARRYTISGLVEAIERWARGHR